MMEARPDSCRTSLLHGSWVNAVAPMPLKDCGCAILVRFYCFDSSEEVVGAFRFRKLSKRWQSAISSRCVSGRVEREPISAR
jgi:hypothetical protein